ncbi:MAG: hypothetical protein JWM27_69 [Gemmatimonadetes bacterium]|nr:hypothetical protein [Gemmatimonadota bacterium]
MRPIARVVLSAVLLSAVLAACSDNPTTPARSAPTRTVADSVPHSPPTPPGDGIGGMGGGN